MGQHCPVNLDIKQAPSVLKFVCSFRKRSPFDFLKILKFLYAAGGLSFGDFEQPRSFAVGRFFCWLITG